MRHFTFIVTLLMLYTLSFCDGYRQYVPKQATIKNIDTCSFNLLSNYIYEYNNKYIVAIGNSKPNIIGKQLFIFEQDTDKTVLHYSSSGSDDSYILKPYFYKCPNIKAPYIILAEIGTEYSWGLRVFLIEDKEIKEIGTIPAYIDTKKALLHSGI